MYIPSKGSDDDHCYDATKKEDHNDGVDDRKPMDLYVGHAQVHIPSGCPAYI